MATLRTYGATVGSFSPSLHLRLSETAGTTAADSADDHDGEYRGGVTLGADGPIGNGAVGLDGSTGYVLVPHDDQLLLDSGSFEVWFTADTVDGDHNLFAKNSAGFGSGGQVAMVVRDGHAFAALGDLTDNHLVVGDDDDDPKVEAGVPAHMVFTFGAEGMELYLNGQLVDADPYTGGLAGNSEPLVVGAENGTNDPGTPIDQPGDLIRFFDGAIDEFVVYDQALSQAQVQALFEAGEAGPRLLGTAAADRLLGGSDGEDLRGRGGDDLIIARGGDDALRGGGGEDDLRGGSGADAMFGGGGGDRMIGAAGDDLLSGGGGADRMIGGAGADTLLGGGGADRMIGGAGADTLLGGAASDRLSGGGGADTLNGGPGRDNLIGGAGADTFQIDRIGQGVDSVRDYTPAEGDVLDLSAVVDFSGGDANDFVQLNELNGNTNVDVNADGAGGDFTTVFRLVGTTGLDLNALVGSDNVQLEQPTS